MIQDIIESKYQSSLMTFLFLAPPRAFSEIELTKRLSIPLNRFQEEVAHLQKQSAIKSFVKGKHKYYLLNTKHKGLLDLRQSVIKGQKIYDDELYSAIRKLGEVKAAFLSGIFTGNPQLPVDILLVGKINLNKLSEFLTGCKKMMGQDINYSIMSPEEFILRRDTFDRFIKDIFDYDHLTVVEFVTKNKKK